ncbi:hypothetical protein FRB97_006805 [Tulasnella sp. 331]|nr:hypothetical protein FRB97_006805 [Tulasnella sp. 331]
MLHPNTKPVIVTTFSDRPIEKGRKPSANGGLLSPFRRLGNVMLPVTCGPLAKQIEGTIVQGASHHTGAYADVYRGTWTPPGKPTISVAIKRLRSVKMSKKISRDPVAMADCLDKRLRREVWTWERLSHPNITPLLGYRSGDEPIILTPYYENGNLAEYLERQEEAPRLKLLVQAANGLLHLHTQKPVVIHGDIKPDNVHEMRTGLTTSGLGQGGLGFIAPEIMINEGNKDTKTTRSDVYAVGGLILNVLSGQTPFHHLNSLSTMMHASQGLMPPRDQHPEIDAAATIWDLMESCWKFDAKSRPDMQQVYLQLQVEEAYFSETSRLRLHHKDQWRKGAECQPLSPTIPTPSSGESAMNPITPDNPGNDNSIESVGLNHPITQLNLNVVSLKESE